MDEAGVLVLEDGTEFEGFLFGAIPSSIEIRKMAGKQNGKQDFSYGEVVFNTSMTGYQEILTDPSYYGQMVCMTAAHIGNTGVNFEDIESAHPWCAGFLIRDLCTLPSNWRSKDSLDDYLKRNHVPGLWGIDTRALTRHLRSRGVVRGILLPKAEKNEARELLKELPRFEGRDLISEVTTREPYIWNLKHPLNTPVKTPAETAATTPPLRVVTLDFGVKWNLLRLLQQKGCEVEVVPAHTSAEAILAKSPNGVFLSNGPGDPQAAPYAADTVRGLLGKVPLFGVCMGHQILALALGAKTYKLKFGHRGGNQPVQDQTNGLVEISSHNHGYSVDGSSLPSNVEVTHTNLNDKTIEGIRVKDAPAFSVQYHPEASPGPHDSLVHFDRFIDTMRKNVSKIS